MSADLDVRDIPPADYEAAVGVAARGMRDNPLHVSAFGADPERRRRRLERQFAALFELMPAQTPICAVEGDTIVGVAGIARRGVAGRPAFRGCALPPRFSGPVRGPSDGWRAGSAPGPSATRTSRTPT